MQPVILRQGLRLRCVLLLFFSVLRVWANFQEGSVLQKWKSSLSDPNNNLESWKDSTDPCGTNPWNHIICVEGVFVKRIDISGSGLSGQLFPGLGQLSRLEALTVYNNRFNGSIPAALGNLSSLSFLDMHNNTLSGSIPDALGKLSKLTTLNLGYNSLSGTIPASLTNLNSLLVIDLRNNSLTGKVPNNGSFSKLDAQSSFEGNTGLCGSLVNLQCPGDPPLSSATPGSTGSVGAIGGGVAGVIAVLLFGIGLFIWWRRRRRQRQRHPDDKDDFVDEPEQEDNLEIHLGQLKRYTFAQLRQATDNFSIKNEVGHGGFGKVYKGVLPDGTLLAVKRLKRERTQGNEEQFQMEVHIISMATHRNLLGLYGFCMTPTERMLVYPFMSNGSVSSQLQKADDGGPPLSCKARKKIALGAAKGLAYLHEQCDPKIIHRDVKADNILLDDEMEAVVGDFGLAKAVDFKNTHVTTAIRGTLGHIAPEYMSTGKSSEKTDVYGYGITLLQLITGQGAVNLSRLADNDEVMLLDWVKKLEKEDRVEVMVDPNLKEYDVADIKELLRVALLCTINSSSARPKMSEVVSMLEGDGLEERWEEWEQKEVKSREALYRPHFPAEWALDSNSSFMQKFVLSGPR